MTRLLNILIVILEVIAFSKSIKGRKIWQLLVYYTQLSNFLTFIASLLFVLFGAKEFVEILRYISVCMLIMTFLVTACVLVPMSHDAKGLLFSGSGLFHHLIIPILSSLTYFIGEPKAPFAFIWTTPLVTLIYGLIMLRLNYIGIVEGPYPFFKIRNLGALKTTAWMIVLMIVVSIISALGGLV